MVALFTIRFDSQKLYILLTQYIKFCMGLRTDSDHFLTQHLVVFVVKRECVYCAVRTKSLNIIRVNFRLSPQKPVLDPKSVNMTFVLNKLVLRYVLL